jgi:Cu/Ag efflux pump CusA
MMNMREPAMLGRFKARHQAGGAPVRCPGAGGLGGGADRAGGAGGFLLLGSELLPAFRERHYVLGIKGPPGASFDWMRARARACRTAAGHSRSAERRGADRPGRSGRGHLAPIRAKFHVRLKPVSAAGEDEALAAIRKVLADTPGIESETTTFLGDRIGDRARARRPRFRSACMAPIWTSSTGGAQVAGVLAATPGAVEVRVKSQPGAPVLGVTLDPARMALHGVSAGDGRCHPRHLCGLTAGQISLADRTLDVAVSVPPALRRDPEALGDVLVRGSGASAVRLADIATISLGTARATIEHEGGQRRQVVTANAAGGANVARSCPRATQIAAKIKLPPGVYLMVGRGRRTGRRPRQLLSHVALATAVAWWRCWCWPLAACARRCWCWRAAAGDGRGVGGGADGRRGVAGGAGGFHHPVRHLARNAMLVAHADHLVAEEGAAWSLETVLRAVRERVTPILLTALVTGFALVPLALETGQAGREIRGRWRWSFWAGSSVRWPSRCCCCPR